MINVITNIIPTKKLDVEELITFVLKQLNIDNISISVSYNKNVCNQFSTKDIQINAVLDKTSKQHNYNLVIREKFGAPEIICHEMVHLKQYENNELNVIKENNTTTFIGHNKEYPSSTDYWQRPGEKEAHELDNKLLKEYKKGKKEGN